MMYLVWYGMVWKEVVEEVKIVDKMEAGVKDRNYLLFAVSLGRRGLSCLTRMNWFSKEAIPFQEKCPDKMTG